MILSQRTTGSDNILSQTGSFCFVFTYKDNATPCVIANMASRGQWGRLHRLWLCSSRIMALSFWRDYLVCGPFHLGWKVVRIVRNEMVKKPRRGILVLTIFFRVSGWECGSHEGQAHRLCCPLVKQWSLEKTLLFLHMVDQPVRKTGKACSALCSFAVVCLKTHGYPKWKHTVHSTRSFCSQMHPTLRGLCHKHF